MSKYKIGLSIVALFVFTSMAVSLTVSAKSTQAQQGVDNSSQNSNSGTTANNQSSTGKLANAKLKACQNRVTAINNIMVRVTDRGTKQLAVFDKISERVQTFYESKGYTLDNYDALLADVVAARSEVQSSVQTMAQNGLELDCGSDIPKEVTDGFKTRARAQTVAMQEYKTAIKNLIVGVKSAANQTENTTEVTE